jgi:hypothetical protein
MTSELTIKPLYDNTSKQSGGVSKCKKAYLRTKLANTSYDHEEIRETINVRKFYFHSFTNFLLCSYCAKLLLVLEYT